MRHYFLSRAIAAHPSGMGPPSGKAGLVTPGRRSLGLSAGPKGAVAATVNLAPVTTAADHHLAAAGDTQEQPARDRLGLSSAADAAWTNAVFGGIVILHACPARCGARRRCRTAKLGSAPCLPSSLAGTRHAAETTLRSEPHPPGTGRSRAPAVARLWSGLRPARRRPTAGAITRA